MTRSPALKTADELVAAGLIDKTQLPEIRDVDAGGVPARLYRPSAQDGLGLLVYLHGGGWVLGSVETHDHVARALAAQSGCAVLSLDYRLAPEHPFPAGLDDAFAATGWTYEHAEALGCDPERLAIGGDSAGANLAAVVTQSARVPFGFQLLVYPVADARGESASMTELADRFWLRKAEMAWFLRHYLSGGDGAPDDPLLLHGAKGRMRDVPRDGLREARSSRAPRAMHVVRLLRRPHR